jgi:hypothetical protein
LAAENVFALVTNTASVCRETWIHTTWVSLSFVASYAIATGPLGVEVVGKVYV